jgi:hypothetical protein
LSIPKPHISLRENFYFYRYQISYFGCVDGVGSFKIFAEQNEGLRDIP